MRLVLAEDHALLRAGLTQLLETHGFTVIASVANEADLEDALQDPEAEAAVVDVRLPPTQTDEGLRSAIAVRAVRPGFPVMVLSQYVEHLYARELLASGEGAIGYLLKNRVSDGSSLAARCSTPRWSPRSWPAASRNPSTGSAPASARCSR